MASYTEEEFAQMIAQLEDSGQSTWPMGLKNIMHTFKVTYKDAAVIQEDLRLKQESQKGACILEEMRKDRSPLEQMTKRVQEAETELSLIKGLNRNEVKELQKKLDEKQETIDRMGKENYELYKKIAQLKQDMES
tara:strand:+ start:255 stop:659 length:405 start_codon:yes stop_codon:yes gene_type:complete